MNKNKHRFATLKGGERMRLENNMFLKVKKNSYICICISIHQCFSTFALRNISKLFISLKYF